MAKEATTYTLKTKAGDPVNLTVLPETEDGVMRLQVDQLACVVELRIGGDPEGLWMDITLEQDNERLFLRPPATAG